VSGVSLWYFHYEKHQWYTVAQLAELYRFTYKGQVIDLLSSFAEKYLKAVAGTKKESLQLYNPSRIKREYAANALLRFLMYAFVGMPRRA
jgi:hypothetical protein